MSRQTAAEYRASAEECEQLAAAATSQETCQTLTYLAHRWRTLASQSETRKIIKGVERLEGAGAEQRPRRRLKPGPP